MKTVNKSHFAKMCGVSKVAVSKACKAGNLGTTTEGNKEVINLGHRLTKEYMRSKEVAEPEKKTPAKKPAKSPVEITAPVADNGDRPDLMIKSLDDVNGSNILLLDKKDLDKLHVYEKALETKLKREERRGDLIPRVFVRQVFSKLYSIYVNQFKTMEDRLTPDICGIFGFSDSDPEAVKLRELLSKDTTKTLTHIKRLFDDSLVKVKGEKL